jgi:2-phosphosulfolactate phosphatase
MKASVHFSPTTLREEVVRGRTAVVLDVLRASTTIAYALHAGARGVIPASSIEAATEMVVKLGRDDVLLCAEHDLNRVDGCDLGNSPLDYHADAVAERLIVLSTTNGSRAAVTARSAFRLYAGSYVNAGRVVDALAGADAVVMICAGNEGAFALEDAACAGYLLHRLETSHGIEVEPVDDGAWVALRLGREAPASPLELLRQSSHGQRLLAGGFERDLVACAEVDTRPVLPVLRDHMLVRSD